MASQSSRRWLKFKKMDFCERKLTGTFKEDAVVSHFRPVVKVADVVPIDSPKNRPLTGVHDVGVYTA